MTIAQEQDQHQLNQASTISQATVPLLVSSAQNPPANPAEFIVGIPEAPKPHQYQGNGEELQFFEDPNTRHSQIPNENIYSFQWITQKALDKLKECVKPPSCTTYRGFYGYALDEYSMVDTKRKILMEFSPKADCTAAVVAFLETSGYQQNDDYFGWPHIFRERYYDSRCGEATHCLYYDPTWFRFKVVRNPFDRAVSSYLYVMKTDWLNEFLPAHIKRTSFEGFINYLLTLSPDVFQYFCTRHAGPQSQYYE
eukprot:gene17041-19495_t